MDPADTQHGDPTVQTALRKQSEWLSHHDHALRSLLETTQQLLRPQPLAPTPTLADRNPAQDIPTSNLDPYSGDSEKCRGFLFQCWLIFFQRSQAFATDQEKIYFVIGLLRGKALTWAEALSGRPLNS